jgi:broad specificity phosphatase PhoE
MKEIYFIRHGETEWNKLKLGQGSRNDIPLNKDGKMQAKLTGKYLNKYRQNDKEFDLILSSPMLRTKETAEIIAKQIDYKKDIIYFKELIEKDQGLISIGKIYEELKKDNFYDDFFKWVDLYEKTIDPIEKALFNEKNKKLFNKIIKKYEMETEENIQKRIKFVLKYIEKCKENKILVISHGGTINELNKYILNAYETPYGDFTNGSNCHITSYTYENKKFKLIMAPNTLHLGVK